MTRREVYAIARAAERSVHRLYGPLFKAFRATGGAMGGDNVSADSVGLVKGVDY